jgi:hypothetical protein
VAGAADRGAFVSALPLAQITGVGQAEEIIPVSWNQVKRGKCLVILKENASEKGIDVDTEASAESLADEPRRKRGGRSILRTGGLARSFGVISLGSFTVLSVGVSGGRM